MDGGRGGAWDSFTQAQKIVRRPISLGALGGDVIIVYQVGDFELVILNDH